MRLDRFRTLLADPSSTLDWIMAVIASIDPAAPPEQDIVDSLDALAGQVEGSTPSTIVLGVFGGLGFTGNADDYYDTQNSLIHRVLARRLGIPLALAVVTIEIARRHDVEVKAVGMPGHVLLGSTEGWHDPFAGGAPLDRDGCEQIFHRIHPDAPFQAGYLQTMSTSAIAARTLENLRVAAMGGGDLAQLASILELRAEVPEAPVDHRMEYARLLELLGRYDLAAEQRDRLAGLLPLRADHHLAEAARLRHHRN